MGAGEGVGEAIPFLATLVHENPLGRVTRGRNMGSQPAVQFTPLVVAWLAVQRQCS